MRYHLYPIFLLGILASKQATASSHYCDWASTDTPEKGEILALVSPVPEAEQTEFETTKLRVWKLYRGEADQHIFVPNWSFFDFWEIDIQDTLGTQNYRKIAMPMQRNKDGSYTNICRLGYSESDIDRFLDSDTPFGSNELCFQKIKQAYDAEVFVGSFQLDDTDVCERFIPIYDAEFRIPPRP